jgi:hypothetical protein
MRWSTVTDARADADAIGTGVEVKRISQAEALVRRGAWSPASCFFRWAAVTWGAVFRACSEHAFTEARPICKSIIQYGE